MTIQTQPAFKPQSAFRSVQTQAPRHSILTAIPAAPGSLQSNPAIKEFAPGIGLYFSGAGAASAIPTIGDSGFPVLNPQPRILLSLDFDGTLSRDIDGVKKLLEELGDSVLLHVNTGRTLDDLGSVRWSLAELPVFAISTGNGESLFVNRNRLNTKDWIDDLADRHQEPAWTRKLKTETNWTHAAAVSGIKEAMASGPRGRVMMGYGDTEFFYRLSDGATKTDAVAFADGVLEKLKSGNPPISGRYEIEEELGRMLFKFLPETIDKSSPVQHIASFYPSLEKIVVAGDNKNDFSLMRMGSVNLTDKSVPVLAVAVNVGDTEFIRTLKGEDNPGLIFTDRRPLSTALREQINKGTPDDPWSFAGIFKKILP